jgi:adenylate kinase
MSPVVIFLGGIPGAGKSTLGRQLQNELPTLLHVSAGELLAAELGHQSRHSRPAEVRDREGVPARATASDQVQADRFQDIIIEAFHRRRRGHTGPILLDGHFVVPTLTRFHPVTVHVFRQLGVARLALLDAKLAQIAHRLRMRGETHWWDGSLSRLRCIYREEAAHARAVAQALGIDLVEVPAGLPCEKVSSLLGIPASRQS